MIRTPGSALDMASLIGWCDGKMARFMVPAHVAFVDDIPRTPTGKPSL